jgi:hypothetical protein
LQFAMICSFITVVSSRLHFHIDAIDVLNQALKPKLNPPRGEGERHSVVFWVTVWDKR